LAETAWPQDHALVLTGVRRCGKSTLQRQIRDREAGPWVTLNLEDTRLYGMEPGDFAAILAAVVALEGGYVDHPDDPGGATNLGITHATLAAWRGKPVTKQDVRNLTVAEAAAIYRARYWDAVRGDELPAGVDLAVFDFAVNSGISTAIRYLQKAVGVADDGHWGPISQAALEKYSESDLIMLVLAERLDFMTRLKNWPDASRGWARRIATNLRYGAEDS
jgi:lysozyme family protein